MKRVIALLTDFGIDDNYVGIMKGTIFSINPNVEIIDVTHSIQPGNIRQAAFILMTSVNYFPEGTIFVVVVDPGVGSNRYALCAKVGKNYFVAPDNGVLSYVLQNHKNPKVHIFSNEKYQLENPSKTFHGRDIFAPLSAYLAMNIDLAEFGEEINPSKLVQLPSLKCYFDSFGNLIGEVVHIDRFGNIITSLSARSLGLNMHNILKQDLKWKFEIGHTKIKNISMTYSDVEEGEFLAYIGSSGFLEIGVRNGNAAKQIGAYIGQLICAKKVGIFEQFV
ncbi:MAG: SAM-dependent chlorinase/fluorinase [Ignavibacteria bacterium]|nr:SAM-dependent chlorinase/fluorinase [Ignavibacteria bacterium]